MTVIAFPQPPARPAPSALDAPTVSVPVEDTVPIGPRPVPPVHRPVPAPGYGYPVPAAYPVPPMQTPYAPAGTGGVPVPWGPPSGPLPVARPVPPYPVPAHLVPPRPVPPRPGPAAPRRRPATALVMAVLLFVLLVGGGIAAYVGFSVGPAYSTGAVVGQ
ncbi:hypothetical protein WCD74_22560 [Actinomycetospora sp. OC33-EN08]|uniref:Uncharacterized protein n=1 Tax=Actinomycetospora aurantiaca TaxID=3129233 RepID=A0ABU8MTB2_9PSEU